MTDELNQANETPRDERPLPSGQTPAPIESTPPAPSDIEGARPGDEPRDDQPVESAAIEAEPILEPTEIAEDDDEGETLQIAHRPPPAAPSKPKSRRKPKLEEDASAEPKPKSQNMDWYILKVQSNREESIREGLLRRMAMAGLDFFVGDVIVPTEKVTEFKGGKKRVTKRKLYPGYLVVQMEINEETWFLVRETPGIGDFTGAAGRPAPMLPHEVSRIVSKQEEKSEKAPKLNIGFRPGDPVKINEGTFENFEGQVETIDETNGRVTVMINIFGRSTPVELEYWQIGAV